MPIPTVKADGASIPSLGFGTWQAREDECRQAVALALGAGYRHIDTAAAYENETAVGEAVRASGVARGEIFLTTKVRPADADDGPLQRSAEASLKKLGLDHVDLLLVHWPSPKIPVKRTMAALARAKRAGLTKHIGVSNYTVPLLDEAVAVSDEPIVTNQCEYHPRLDQKRLVEACRRHDVAFTSYCPLGRGGDILSDKVVTDIAARHGKTPAQVLLRWQVQQPDVIAIPKSSHRERIAQNIAIFDFTLAEEEMAALFRMARPDGRIVSPGWAPDWDR